MKKVIFQILLIFLYTTAFAQSESNPIFKPEFIRQSKYNAAKWQLKHPKNEVSPKDWTNGAIFCSSVENIR